MCGMKLGTNDSPCNNSINNERPQCGTGTYNWLLMTGVTPSDPTGPYGGYQGSLYYIYMEASNMEKWGNGLFTSIYIPVYLLKKHTGPACVEFGYHMRDDSREDMGTLRLLQGEPGKPATTLWSKSGHQEDDWLIGHVNVTLLGNDQISWKGIRGIGTWSDIAIDDITIYACFCQDVQNSTGTCELSTAETPTTTVTTTSPAHHETSTDVVSDQSVVQHAYGSNGMMGVAVSVGVSIGLLGIIGGIIIAVVIVKKRSGNTSTVGTQNDITQNNESSVYYEIHNDNVAYYNVPLDNTGPYVNVNPDNAQTINGEYQAVNPQTVQKPADTPEYDELHKQQ